MTRSRAHAGRVLLLVSLLGSSPAPARAQAPDEQVVLYPSYLAWDEAAASWRGHVHGKVHEVESGPITRLARAALRETLGLSVDPAPDEEAIFGIRSAEFLVDNERGERVWIEVEGRRFVSRPSAASGHFQVDVSIPGGGEEREIATQAGLVGAGRAVAAGRVRLLAPRGISIISDLDDTIKRTGVLDTHELIANTFFRPYEAVPGMAGVYRRWAEQGAAVHLLTASPWQLYPSLARWLDRDGFPWVTMEMRLFRMKDRSFIRFFRSSERYKTERIEEILDAFPKRRFVLVGDSGERDPEVYGRLARRHPGVVAGILIRAVLPGPGEPERYREAFDGVEEGRWLVFRDAGELPSDLSSWLDGVGPLDGSGSLASARGRTCM